jgi:hypothetical protein
MNKVNLKARKGAPPFYNGIPYFFTNIYASLMPTEKYTRNDSVFSRGRGPGACGLPNKLAALFINLRGRCKIPLHLFANPNKIKMK